MTRKRTTPRNINQFSIVLTEKLSEKIRRYCFDNRLTYSEAFEEAIISYLQKQGEIDDKEDFYKE